MAVVPPTTVISVIDWGNRDEICQTPQKQVRNIAKGDRAPEQPQKNPTNQGDRSLIFLEPKHGCGSPPRCHILLVVAKEPPAYKVTDIC